MPAALVCPSILQRCTPPFAGKCRVCSALWAAVQCDPEAMVGAVDGIGIYDSIWRAVMLSQLVLDPQANAALSFVHIFYDSPSECI